MLRSRMYALFALSLLSLTSTAFAQIAVTPVAQQVEGLVTSLQGVELNFSPLTPGMGVSSSGGTLHFALAVGAGGSYQGLVSVTSPLQSDDTLDAMRLGMSSGKLPRAVAKKSDLHIYITDAGTIVAGESGANKILGDLLKKKPIKTKAPQSMFFPGNLIAASISGVVESVGLVRLPTGGSFMAMKGLAKLVADGNGNFILFVMSRSEAIVIGSAGYAEVPAASLNTLLNNLSLAGHFNAVDETSKIFLDAD